MLPHEGAMNAQRRERLKAVWAYNKAFALRCGGPQGRRLMTLDFLPGDPPDQDRPVLFFDYRLDWPNGVGGCVVGIQAEGHVVDTVHLPLSATTTDTILPPGPTPGP
jgi:hypothetical protein